MKQRSWYIGKANLIREDPRISGVTARFQEHVKEIWKPNDLWNRERRYLEWWKANPEDFHRQLVSW